MNEREKKLVLWFEEMGIEDVENVGGKSASLGEMTAKTGVPVPYGFATTKAAFDIFMSQEGLSERIKIILDQLVDPEDSEMLRKVGEELRTAIIEAEIDSNLEETFKSHYRELTKKYQEELGGEGLPYVAVRSSATAEDLPDASFAGQQETYLNVIGEDELVKRIKECYSSLFTDRAIYYRVQKGFAHLDVALSAVVQLMVFSKAAGVMFTLNTSTGDRNQIDIEAAFGLGEYVVQGKVSPNNYVVDKETMQIVEKDVNPITLMLARDPEGGVKDVYIDPEVGSKQVISDEQILELAGYAKDIEKHYGRFMDIEWGLDERTEKLWILQARPETVWSRKTDEKKEETGFDTVDPALKPFITELREVISKGRAASPGLVFGKAMVYPKDELEKQMRELEKADKMNEAKKIEKEWKANVLNTFEKGTILVTEMTDPDWVPAMKRAVAIVTNSGGKTCHAAIVSREMGIPCIVGTANMGDRITDAVKTGDYITVDASSGVVYKGILEDAIEKQKAASQQAAAGGTVVAEYFPPTGTRVYMNLGDPDLAEKFGPLPCDGIGLMREEFIWATFIKQHPLYLIEKGQENVVIDQLAEGIRKMASALWPRPVILRLADFKSSEYRDLEGGEEYEPVEPAPLLGWRGASRYYDPKYAPAFKLELRAIKKVREELGLTNVHVMIPFCRTVDECRKTIELMRSEGLVRHKDFKIWLMAEIPSNIILADKFNEYVDGYSIGSNDLTMLVLGLDRDSDTIAHISDERDLAVKRMIKQLIKAAHAGGKTVSICGQAPSFYPDFTEFLIKEGIDSVSVNPDTVKATKKLVAAVEQRIMLDAMTGKGRVSDPDLEWL